MLKELFIHNIAIIDDLTIKLHSGLNIITGETGAGKSVIIGTLGLLLGLRASSDILRTGCEKGSVTGAFDIDSSFQKKLAEFSIPDIEDGLLVLSREISREGKNLCRINEKIYSLSGFRAVGSLLLDIYGQNEERGLLVPGNQLEILDQLGGPEVIKCKEETGRCYKRLTSLEREIASEIKRKQEVGEQYDYLQFQMNELETADLRDTNEEQTLEEEIAVLSGAEALAEKSLEIYGLLFGREGTAVYDSLSRALEILEQMAAVDPSLKGKLEEMKEALYSVQDMSDFFRNYGERVEYNPQKLEMLQDRLELLRRLCGKYKKSIQELISYREEIASVLDNQMFGDQKIEKLKKEKDEASSEYCEKAGILTRLRKKTGDYLSQQVTVILRQLEMKDAQFRVDFSSKKIFSETGMEEIRFLFSANPGEPMKPLQKVASGGELSRLMLALKSVLAKVESVPVLVFDEADTGIGGEAAGKVGFRIAKLAASHQVICVTHSAQVAVFADAHFVIGKKIHGQRTVAQVRELSGKERTFEIARMIGGKELDTAVKHAERMLESAAHEKK